MRSERLASLIVLMILSALAGCGSGSMSAAQMRARAEQRAAGEVPEDDEPDPGQPADEAGPSSGSPAPVPNQTERTPGPKAGASEPSSRPPTQKQATSPGSPIRETPARSESLPTATSPASLPQPIDALQASELAASRLQEVGKAFFQFTDSREMFPSTNHFRLSWRVRLLPELGHQALYAKFRPHEPWDSPHNRSLLAEIPAVYQSPERGDVRTNILASPVVVRQRPLDLDDAIDPLAQTIALVEVDDQAAVPWTKPDDLRYSPTAPLQGLKRRVNACLVASVRGDVHRLRVDAAGAMLAGLFSCDGGEDATFAAAAPTEPIAKAETPSDSPAPSTRPSARPARSSTAAAGESLPLRVGNQPLGKPHPVPGVERQRAIRRKFADLLSDDFSRLSLKSEQKQFAEKLLRMSEEFGHDPDSQYVLLDIVGRIARSNGEMQLARDVLDRMTSSYEVDKHTLRRKCLQELSRTLKSSARLAVPAAEYAEQAMNDAAFEAAEALCRLAIASTANQLGKVRLADQLAVIQGTAKAHDAADKAIERLQLQPDDPAALYALGKYLCLFRDDWVNGLPSLASSGNPSFRQLAELELAQPGSADEMIALADRWLAQSDSVDAAMRLSMRRRALRWYSQALPSAPAGFVRIKVQKRIEELQSP